jgi:hypothetical protein
MSAADPPIDDPYLNEIIERTLARYRRLVSPAVLAAMRLSLIHALTEDEVGVDLLRRARPRASPLRSGEEPVDGKGEAPEAAAGWRRGHGG